MEKLVKKTYADCYLYNKHPVYNKVIFEAIMTDNFINKANKAFEDVVYEVKRARVNINLVKVLQSNKTVLIRPEKGMPSTFVSFVAKDPRANKELKLFIDVTNCIFDSADGGYRVNEIRLLSHLISGYYAMKYNVVGSAVIARGNQMELGAICFASLFTYVIDYIAKISITPGAKDKCMYFAARYFAEGICCGDADRARAIARKVADITEIKENTYSYMAKETDAFTDLRVFVNTIKKVFNISKLTTDIIVEKWMFLFGPCTVFALEFLPAFIGMMTDAYIGSFFNNQKTIEKVCGRSMIELSKNLIDSIS